MLAEVDFLRKVFSLIKGIVKVGSKIQGKARENLIKDLQAVSSKVHDAYSTIIKRLAPIKKAYGNPAALVVELRNLESDKDTRDSFKPSKLCGEVDFLLDRLKNNLDPLKYSVDIRKIDDLKQELRDMGSLDNALYEAYDRTMKQVGAFATEIETQSLDNPKGQQLTNDIDKAKHLIQEFEGLLSKAAKEMTDIKDNIVR